MSALSAGLKSKIKIVLDDAQAYNIDGGQKTSEQAKEYLADKLSLAISDWLSNLTLVIPSGLVQVSGSSTNQANTVPIQVPLLTLKP